MAYVHRPPPGDARALPAFLQQELPRIAQGMQAAEMSRSFRVLYEEPEKYAVGDVVYADGTTWNPGSGEGLYVRKSGGWGYLG